MSGSQQSFHSSDISHAILSISRRSDLIGYRNVLSYASALGLRIYPESVVELDTNPLGAGSHSATYRGTLHETGKDSVVAVKQPNGSYTRDKREEEESVQHVGLSSIIQEARILADPKLRSHPHLPHIIGIYFQVEIHPEGVRPCMILELAVMDFREFMYTHRSNSGDSRKLVRACSQIASGLCALHAYGLVHGDVKPENVLMFERNGDLVAAVADLGTCGVPSQAETIVGTRHFWAPEVHPESRFRAFANRFTRDIYSFGLVAFTASTRYRENLFPNDKSEQFKLQHDDKLCSDTLLAKMPQESVFDNVLRETVRLCVRTNPDSRPTIFEVARILEECVGETKLVDLKADVTAANHSRDLVDIQNITEGALISDPTTPRASI